MRGGRAVAVGDLAVGSVDRGAAVGVEGDLLAEPVAADVVVVLAEQPGQYLTSRQRTCRSRIPGLTMRTPAEAGTRCRCCPRTRFRRYRTLRRAALDRAKWPFTEPRADPRGRRLLWRLR